MDDENRIPDSWIYGGLVLAAVLVVVFLALLGTAQKSLPPAPVADCPCTEGCPDECTGEDCPCPVTPVVQPEPSPQPEPKPEPEPDEPAPLTDEQLDEIKHQLLDDVCPCSKGCTCLMDKASGVCDCANGDAPPCCDDCQCAPSGPCKSCGCEPRSCHCAIGGRLCGKSCKCVPLNVPYTCEACSGTINVGYGNESKITPAFQCYRCPANPNGRKPLMYWAGSRPTKTARPPVASPRQPAFRGSRFYFGSGGGFGSTMSGGVCIGST